MSTVSSSYVNVPSEFTVIVSAYSTVRNASFKNGLEMIPVETSPARARTVNVRASGAAGPAAIATWPRGIAIAWKIVPVASSHSQYPTWSWNVVISPGVMTWTW